MSSSKQLTSSSTTTNNNRAAGDVEAQQEGGGTWFDNACENATDAVCPGPSQQEIIEEAKAREEQPEEPDMLDVVFESVESFTCAADSPSGVNNQQGEDGPNGPSNLSSQNSMLSGWFKGGKDYHGDVEGGSKATASVETVDERTGTIITTTEEYPTTEWYQKRGYQILCGSVCVLACVLIAMIVLFFTR